MKAYQKAEMIAKNLPTGSYAAGCPTGQRMNNTCVRDANGNTWGTPYGCQVCEIAA